MVFGLARGFSVALLIMARDSVILFEKKIQKLTKNLNFIKT
jgi:hypothetical protein